MKLLDDGKRAIDRALLGRPIYLLPLLLSGGTLVAHVPLITQLARVSRHARLLTHVTHSLGLELGIERPLLTLGIATAQPHRFGQAGAATP